MGFLKQYKSMWFRLQSFGQLSYIYMSEELYYIEDKKNLKVPSLIHIHIFIKKEILSLPQT